jgi:hypothetical protein
MAHPLMKALMFIVQPKVAPNNNIIFLKRTHWQIIKWGRHSHNPAGRFSAFDAQIQGDGVRDRTRVVAGGEAVVRFHVWRCGLSHPIKPK